MRNLSQALAFVAATAAAPINPAEAGDHHDDETSEVEPDASKGGECVTLPNVFAHAGPAKKITIETREGFKKVEESFVLAKVDLTEEVKAAIQADRSGTLYVHEVFLRYIDDTKAQVVVTWKDLHDLVWKDHEGVVKLDWTETCEESNPRVEGCTFNLADTTVCAEGLLSPTLTQAMQNWN